MNSAPYEFQDVLKIYSAVHPWFRFGSVLVSSICYRPGFGSCSVSVPAVPGRLRFGSVFGTFCIDICFSRERLSAGFFQ